MEVHTVTFVFCLLLFSELFGATSGDSLYHGPIVYTRDQLLAMCHTPLHYAERPEIPAEIRRRRRGCRAGVKRRQRKKRYKPYLPSVIMGNVRSLPNKMEELTALTRLQREFRECSIMCFTETWLSELSPDSHVTLDGFQLVRADRTTTGSGKKKGGGIAVFVNERWCHPGHISVKEQLCTRDLELLAVSMRPYYLPREFSHVIAVTVYIPPSAVAAAATDQIHSVVSQLLNQHPHSLLLISGDFNHTSLSSALPTFTQYVKCHTRDNKTLDLLYANIKNAYTSSPLPPLGRSDHNLVHLITDYTPLVNKQPPEKRSVKVWSEETSARLRDCFEITDWEALCSPHDGDIDSMTHCITDYINFCVENTVPSKLVRCFANNKPWVTSEIKALLKEKKRVFRLGDKEELHRVQRELRQKIRKGKDCYRRKLEERLERKNTRDVWSGLQNISGHGKGVGRDQGSGDKIWADELNLFFNRFDSAPSPFTCPVPSSHLPGPAPPPPPLLNPPPPFPIHLQPSDQPPPPHQYNCPLSLPTTPSSSPYSSTTPSSSPQSSTTPLSITVDQVRCQLKKIKARKAPGPDGISPRLLKDCADQLCGVIMHLFNLSLNLEKVPILWKTSCVVPVPKTQRPREPNHFRPVALTSHLMKTLERIILSHLRPLVGTQLDPLQFAYRPGIGVDDAVIYLLHRSLLHLEDSGSTVRVMFFDFSSAFNTILPSVLRVKMESAGVDQHLAAWTTDFLTNRPQYVRLHHCVSDVVLCSTGAPQGTVLSPFLFTLYTSDFTHNTTHCHIQKFSDDTAIVGCVSEGNDLEYRTVIKDFVSWCKSNQLHLNASKTKEMIVNFRRKTSHFTPVNIQGLDIEVVENYKFLGVHLNNKLDWSDNTHALYKKGQSRLHLLRRLRSFGVCGALLRTFYDSVVASAIYFAVVCWRGGSTDRDRQRLNKLIQKASSVLGCPLDSIEEVGERRMLAKLTSIMNNSSHPLHDTVVSLSSSFSSRLLHPRCKKERFRRSFIPAAVRLYNTCSS